MYICDVGMLPAMADKSAIRGGRCLAFGSSGLYYIRVCSYLVARKGFLRRSFEACDKRGSVCGCGDTDSGGIADPAPLRYWLSLIGTSSREYRAGKLYVDQSRRERRTR